MFQLTQCKKEFQKAKLTKKDLRAIKGGGWGNGGISKGKGCPPPNVMEIKSWGEDMSHG
jgi:natural product precursor